MAGDLVVGLGGPQIRLVLGAQGLSLGTTGTKAISEAHRHYRRAAILPARNTLSR